MDEHVSHATEHADLKRGIGPWLLFFFVLGDIVGAGIYALVGEVGAVIGGAIWVAFLCAFVLAIFTADLLRRACYQVSSGWRIRYLRQQRLSELVR